MSIGPRSLNLGDPIDRSAAWNPSNVWIGLPNNSGSTTLFDAVGRNHGTLTNGPTWGGSDAAGLGAVVFDGSNDNVTLGTAVSSSAFTLAFRFIRRRGGSFEALAGNGGSEFVGPSDGGANQYFHRLAGWSGGGPTTLGGGRGLGVWQTLVFTYRSGVHGTAHLNGVRTALSDYGSGTATYSVFGDRSGFPFQGSIQSIWWWPTDLSDSQAAAFCGEADAGYPTLLRRVSPISWFVGTGGGGGGGGNRRRRVLLTTGGR